MTHHHFEHAPSGDTWLLVADGRLARLFLVTAEGQRLGLAERGEIAFDAEARDHQHGRPHRRRGKDIHSYAARRHDDDEAAAAFAREIAAWAPDEALAGGARRLVVIAPPRLVGGLRAEWPTRPGLVIDEHGHELAGLTRSELERHPTVHRIATEGTAVR